MAELRHFKTHADGHCACGADGDEGYRDPMCAAFLAGARFERDLVVQFMLSDWPRSGSPELDSRLAARDCEMADKVVKNEHVKAHMLGTEWPEDVGDDDE